MPRRLWLVLMALGVGCSEGTAPADARIVDARMLGETGVDASVDAALEPPDADRSIDAASIDVSFDVRVDAVVPPDAVVPVDGGAQVDARCLRDAGAEVCNAFDDDCDGTIDEAVCRGCRTVTGPGERVYLLCNGAVSGFRAWADECQTIGPDYQLVDLDTPAESLFLESVVGTAPRWVGVRRFLPGDAITDATGHARVLTEFDVDPSDTALPEETCFQFGARGLRQVLCTGSAGFVCEAPIQTGPHSGVPETCNWVDDDVDGRIDEVACGTNSVVRRFLDHRYRFEGNELTWDDARALCTGSGAHLAFVESVEENAMLNELRQDANQRSFWLGASRDVVRVPSATDGNFHWFDGRLVDHGIHTWDSGEPSMNPLEDCLSIGFSIRGGWEDRLCTFTRASVCELDS